MITEGDECKIREEILDSLCSENKTNASYQLHIGLMLLSDAQLLHNALVFTGIFSAIT